MLRWSCVSLILASHLVHSLSGQNSRASEQRKWDLSLFIGTSFLSKQSTLLRKKDVSTPVSLGYKAGPSLGFQIGENLGNKFGAEMQYGFSSQPMTIGNLNQESSELQVNHYVHRIMYNFLVYPLGWKRGKLSPYALVGIGASLFTGSNNSPALSQGVGLKNCWKFAGAVGVGLKLFLNGRWGIRFDVRNQMTRIPDYGLPKTAFKPQVNPDLPKLPSGQLHNWQVHTGLFYNFEP